MSRSPVLSSAASRWTPPARVGGVRAGSASERDCELVAWVGRMGAVTLEQLMQRFGLGRTAGYRRVARCASARLLERVETLRGQPSLIRATRRGLGFTGLDLSVAVVSPHQLAHAVRCVDVALGLEREFGADCVLSEREIRALEQSEGQHLASAVTGQRPDGGEVVHRPDLAVVGAGGVIAIEVELTAKAASRLETIVRAWRRARWVDAVRYYADPAVAWRLERAITRTHAGQRVELRELPARPEVCRGATERKDRTWVDRC